MTSNKDGIKLPETISLSTLFLKKVIIFIYISIYIELIFKENKVYF